MRELVRPLPWTTQDEAMWQLMPEMKNIYPIFAVRKSDNFLLGGVALVETDVVYGAFYVMRPDLRGLGVGMKMMAHLVHIISNDTKHKPALGRAGLQHFHENKSVEMFPSNAALPFPYPLANGVALFDASGNVHGLVGAVPTLHNSDLFKIGPIFASNRNDAGHLLKCISDLIPGPNVKFALHISTNTAGDWMLQKCRDSGVPLVFVGTAANSTHNKIVYQDPCNTEMMYAPMNCPIFFDR
ncbi:hypothetical protein COOONC_28621 [Cooperia oncophora]